MSQWAFPQLFPPYTGSSNDKTNVVWRGGGGAFRLSGWIEGEPITLTLMQRNGLAVIALLVGCRKWGSWHFVPNSLYPPCTPPPLDNKVHVHSQNLPEVQCIPYSFQVSSAQHCLNWISRPSTPTDWCIHWIAHRRSFWGGERQKGGELPGKGLPNWLAQN